MTSRKTIPKPTEGELAILQVLWQRGGGTVRDVVGDLKPEPGYTTVLKMMQIMTAKGLLSRDDSQRVHVYSPRIPQIQTQRQLVSDLVARAFDGSAGELVLQALATSKPSKQELDSIRKLLASMEEGRGK